MLAGGRGAKRLQELHGAEGEVSGAENLSGGGRLGWRRAQVLGLGLHEGAARFLHPQCCWFVALLLTIVAKWPRNYLRRNEEIHSMLWLWGKPCTESVSAVKKIINWFLTLLQVFGTSNSFISKQISPVIMYLAFELNLNNKFVLYISKTTF